MPRRRPRGCPLLERARKRAGLSQGPVDLEDTLKFGNVFTVLLSQLMQGSLGFRVTFTKDVGQMLGPPPAVM